MPQIKMRDVPYEDIAYHFSTIPDNASEIWETKLRGKVVDLLDQTPGVYNINGKNIIGYAISVQVDPSDPEGYFWACEICAEIGD